MIRTVDAVLSRVFGPVTWLLPTDATRDAVEALSEALGPAWSVHRETDCEGETSIIVLPLDVDGEAAFVLYERNGVARVATVAGDNWQGDQGFSGFQDAVAAVIAEIGRPSSRVQPDI